MFAQLITAVQMKRMNNSEAVSIPDLRSYNKHNDRGGGRSTIGCDIFKLNCIRMRSC